MNLQLRLTLIPIFGLLSCAQPHARVIEPNSNPSAASEGTAEPAHADDQFLISRAPQKAATGSSNEFPIHLAEKWFPFRGEYLGLTTDKAFDRDTGLSEIQGPGEFWDEQTAIEAVSIWSALCNECHGGRRKIKDALSMPAPPANWGRGLGLFFGKRRPYSEIFNVISRGGPVRDGKPSEMIAWRQRLAKEQIWSIIYFLEYQSGGIEGVFPPSLYPRGGAE